jgi:hypothetical protein
LGMPGVHLGSLLTDELHGFLDVHCLSLYTPKPRHSLPRL